jgi:spermidine/putrescine transport system permease protein
MIGSLIDEQFKGSQGNWPFGAAVSVVLMTLVLIALLFQARAAAKGGRE